ncbi:LicD family protein [Mariniflexile litorale]|uniref:LicD family protein n=1 Tax=Mariniflexile litorale TaxID=3045158 RepID=A0AAU7EF16_9FLAO|nr:LicD family protein [Mariniflexile sp. KMM 9835]MDQ8210803.1 LicD family protein [Mariniflexile sp. KMM 9835]
MAYNITLEGKNTVIAERMLQDVAQILSNCKINYWLEGGTLLGIRREDRLLPWDNDIDMSIMVSEKSKLNNFYNQLSKKKYRVRTRVFEGTRLPFEQGDIRMIKIRERRFLGLIKGSVCLDVFIKYPKDDNIYWEIDNKIKYVPSKFYSSFKSINFKGFNYSIPEFTDEYLTYRYGDWKKAVKDWDTSKDDKALA